jgi:hypothetical protein
MLKQKTKKVYWEHQDEPLGRTLIDDEYKNITAQELRDAIDHSSWGWVVLDPDGLGKDVPGERPYREVRAELNEKSGRTTFRFHQRE